jgi:RNA polymerase sigma-70 factor (ECF subfamily)
MNSVVGQGLWKWKLVAGLLTIVLGAIVLGWPGPSMLVVSTLFSVYLLLSGLAELFMAFSLPRSAATRVMLFISGALSLVLAILSFRHFGDAYAVLLLSLWIGIGFIFQGVSGVAVGIGESDLPGRGWYVVAGIISVIAGLAVLVWPFDSIAVLTLAAGVWLVIIGITQIIRAFQTRKHANTPHHTVDEMSQPRNAVTPPGWPPRSAHLRTTMTVTQHHPRTARGRKPVDKRSLDDELSTRFERDVVPLRETLFRHAFRLSHNHTDAEDLVQETMTKAYSAFHSFRPATNLNAWLSRILTNTYINGYRRTRRQPVLYCTELVTDEHLADVYAHCVPTGMRSSEDEALDLLQDNDIKAAMQALTQQFRGVVYYADVQGFRYKETAAIMKTPVGTVMTRLHRGRQRLCSLLGDGASRVELEPMPAAG